MKRITPIFFASCKPALDPILPNNSPAALPIIAEDAPLVGRALLVGWMLDAPKPIATYRLVVGGAELEGLFIRNGRRFEPIEGS